MNNWVIFSILFVLVIGINIILIKYFVRKKMVSIAKQVMFSDMRAIRAQMNPHFIFNSLNSINRYILKNEPEIASDYLGRFARLMRLVLDNSYHERICLEDEIKAMILYLELEQLRFEHQFDFVINIDEKINKDETMVQPLIFQPFLENAIWHGLMHKEGLDRKLQLDIKLENQIMVCKIIDNGVGRGDTKGKTDSKRKSYGIKLVRDRLQFLDKNASINITDLFNESGEPAGTEVEIRFKKIENYSL